MLIWQRGSSARSGTAESACSVGGCCRRFYYAKTEVAAIAAGKYQEWLTDESLAALKAWSAEGLDFGQIAENMGISESTLREWRKNYPAISAAIKHGRAHAIAQVENALYKRALGYTIPIKKAIKVKVVDYDEKTGRRVREREEIVEAIEEQHIPADSTAQIFYLTNRKPEDWKRNRPEVIADDEEKGTGVILLPEVNAEET